MFNNKFVNIVVILVSSTPHSSPIYGSINGLSFPKMNLILSDNIFSSKFMISTIGYQLTVVWYSIELRKLTPNDNQTLVSRKAQAQASSCIKSTIIVI